MICKKEENLSFDDALTNTKNSWQNELKPYWSGELEMTEGALYPILHKLESDGIIFSEIQNVNGRDRKYYLLTEKGKKQQKTKEAEMKSYIFNLNAIFNI